MKKRYLIANDDDYFQLSYGLFCLDDNKLDRGIWIRFKVMCIDMIDYYEEEPDSAIYIGEYTNLPESITDFGEFESDEEAKVWFHSLMDEKYIFDEHSGKLKEVKDR